MLKTASIFKDFRISVNADNTAVTFYKVSPLSVSVKNDNFATQVQILDNEDTADLFDYKYITFDDSAVFEIKDCIKNEKYTTLFIQYLSNITFETENNNFRVDGVSVATLQRLGFDINQFAEILGNSLKIDYVNYNVEEIAEQEYFIFGIRLRFSELPANLNYRLTGEDNTVALVTDELNVGSSILNPSIANVEIAPDDLLNELDETSIDNAKTVIIPMPVSSGMLLRFSPTNGYGFQFKDVINTLSQLITDLTLTAEIIPITSNTLVFMHDFVPKNIVFEQGIALPVINLPDVAPDMEKFTNMLRVPSGLVSEGKTKAPPCFVIGGMVEGTGVYDIRKWNICEVFDFIKINLPTIETNESYINAIILNNSIDISKIKNNYFYIKRENGYIRIYVDIEKNIYTDIVNTLEFAKNAYSNFDAYIKSNIELVNRQNLTALQQQQQQKRDLQNLDHVISGANSLQRAAFSLGMGSVGGAIGALVGGAVSIAADEAKFNMQQQNEIANNKLAAAQALERARSTITPSSELKGSVSLATALRGAYDATHNYITPVILSKITLTDMQLYNVQKYIFDNLITEKITDITQIKKPEWQKFFNYYQIKITNRSAINTRKDLIIFVEDTAEDATEDATE